MRFSYQFCSPDMITRDRVPMRGLLREVHGCVSGDFALRFTMFSADVFAFGLYERVCRDGASDARPAVGWRVACAFASGSLTIEKRGFQSRVDGREFLPVWWGECSKCSTLKSALTSRSG